MYDIFTYIWLIFMVHAGKYTSPMDPMGMKPWEEDTTILGKWRTIDERNPPKHVVRSSSSHYICSVFYDAGV